MARRSPPPREAFLPTSRQDMRRRGWDELDVLIVSGDAYVDHPAFGPVVIARWLEHHGFRVGFIAQPRWDDPRDLVRMGRPRLFVGVSAGNLDSMLHKLTAQKKVRSRDDYSPGGQTGLRPNRASVVYANLCRQAFPGLPIVLGGIEASLRRLAHYDYWADRVRRSVLLDAKGHLLLFGMAERAVVEVAERLASGVPVDDVRGIPGTAHVVDHRDDWEPLVREPSRHVGDGRHVVLPSYEAVCADKEAFVRMARLAQAETNPYNARPLLQPHGSQAVWLEPPAPPLSSETLDSIASLPFCRAPHPSYDQPIPAFSSVRRSISVVRGCFGGCSFCSIAQHEGRIVQSRTLPSVIEEARTLAASHDFDGTISDVGGPTANAYGMHCRQDAIQRACRRPSCLFPRICPNLVTDHGPLLVVLKSLRAEPGLRHVFINSGIRHDLAERSPGFVRALARLHTSGQLSVAPEHCQPRVLQAMRKPPIDSYERFARRFARESHAAGKDQYLVPYLLVGHPGATLRDAIALASYLKKHDLRPRQIQEFIPTPMSEATTMYHTGRDPSTGQDVFVERDLRRKRAMKALVLWWDPQHWPLAREALRMAGRHDLIGELIPAAARSGRRRYGPPRRR